MSRNSEQEQSQYSKSGRRWRRLLLAGLILAAAVYSGLWYFMAARVESRLVASIGQAAVSGVDIRCQDLRKSGYPLRLAISCLGLSVNQPGKAAPGKDGKGAAAAPGAEGSDGALVFRSAYLTAGAPVYAPHWLLAEIGAPAALKLPYSRVIEADWQKLQCEGDCAAAMPRNIDISAEKLAISNLPFLPDKALLSADFIHLGSRRHSGDKVSFTLSFDDLSIPYTILGAQASLPEADGAAEIIWDQAEDFYAGLPQLARRPETAWLRGKTGKIKKLVLTFANGGGFTLSGPLAVDENGRINGKITLSIIDPAALMRTVRTIFPNQADNLESLFFVLNAVPKNDKGEPQLALDIIDSRMRIMGFVKLGKIPPL